MPLDHYIAIIDETIMARMVFYWLHILCALLQI